VTVAEFVRIRSFEVPRSEVSQLPLQEPAASRMTLGECAWQRKQAGACGWADGWLGSQRSGAPSGCSKLHDIGRVRMAAKASRRLRLGGKRVSGFSVDRGLC